MKCPYCKSEDSKVIDSRPTEDGFATRRRRQCIDCDARYTTYERIEDMQIIIIKKNGQRETFDKNKVVNGIIRACYKRGVSVEKIREIADDIESKIKNHLDNEVTTDYIGQEVMRALKNVDEVAYVRFASVYKSFKDIASFQEMVEDFHDQ